MQFDTTQGYRVTFVVAGLDLALLTLSLCLQNLQPLLDFFGGVILSLNRVIRPGADSDHRTSFRLIIPRLALQSPIRLLHHVRQLVGQQPVAGRRAGGILARPHVDILAVGEGLRAQLAVQVIGLAAGVDAHPAEVGAEARLHAGAHVVGQGAAAAFVGCQAAFDVGASVEAGLRIRDWRLPAPAAPRGPGEIGLGLDLLLVFGLALKQRLGLDLFFVFGLALDERGDGGGKRLGLYLFLFLRLTLDV